MPPEEVVGNATFFRGHRIQMPPVFCCQSEKGSKKTMFEPIFENVRQKSPLVHNITNYVTVNDCANMLLACGGSPIMADDPEDAVEITAICGGLNINIGTLNQRTIPAMLAAGKRSNELGHPVVLDPVGAGASTLRTDTALRLLNEVKFAVIRGNISEIKTLALGSGTTKGVDADVADKVTEENLDGAVAFAKDFARRIGAVVAVTGAIDIVTDGERAFCIRNGRPEMASITGTGCQLSALTAAFVTANPDQPLEAAAAAVCAMGLCGETAHRRMTELDGNSSYRNFIIDAMYRLTPAELEKGAKYEVR
jgi:hydroxyethylthiazole kinase